MDDEHDWHDVNLVSLDGSSEDPVPEYLRRYFRVSRANGQVSCAAATSCCARSRSMPGSETFETRRQTVSAVGGTKLDFRIDGERNRKLNLQTGSRRVAAPR